MPIHSYYLPPTTALLVDEENFHISCEINNAIDKIAKYPLTTKIAFANFTNRPKKSLELHQAGYSLIHVPQLKNAADAQMIVTGCLLFINTPQVKEVFICSNDNIFVFLQKTLVNLRKKVHLVKRQGDHLYINHQLVSQSIPTPTINYPTINTITELDEEIIKLVLQITQKENTSAIQVNLLGSQFANTYGQGVNAFLSEFKLGIKFIDFLKLNPRLNVIQHKNSHYVCLSALVN